MAATERTPLTRPNDSPSYIEYAGLLRTRRTKVRQLQCCICATLLAVLIMALVVTVSYSINEVHDPLVADSTNPEVVPPAPPLQAIWAPPPNSGVSNSMPSSSISTEEWNEAVKAGQEAIALREAADALASPLPAPSPNSRHQYAVKTSVQAGKLALAGIGELAATRSIEKSRTKLGVSSSMGNYFKNIWAPEGTCKEFAKIDCPPSKYRNFDGTCNHPKNYGSSLTPFARKLPPAYADGLEAPRISKYGGELPSAREISLKVHPPAPSSNPSFTVMLAVFGQFLDHDITATALSQGTNGSSLACCPPALRKHPECFPVQVGPGDPVFDVGGMSCMEFVRSAPAPQCKIGPRQQLNQVTSFIDGSVIYGPDYDTAQSLRQRENGLLRMYETPDNRTLLPQSLDPNDGCNRELESARGRYCFASGDGRANENLHLTTMHLLWARQHNRIALALSKLNPTWSDEKIYQETRRIIGAQLQHVTYNEFVPTVLGDKETKIRKLNPLTSGFRSRNYTTDVNPAIANSFAAAAFRFAHTLLPGLMKVTDAQKATSSYVELHRMLFNPYSLYSKGGMESSLTTATSNFIQRTSTHVTSQLTKHLFEDPLSNVSVPCGLDLVSLNIQRGRDHGLPGYTAWREFCGLGKVNTFAELSNVLEPESLDQISKLYAHVEDIDLYTGALAESDKADGLVGPTFRCIIGDQFERLQKGDKFWYEVPGELQSFTEGQLKEIRKTTLAKLICDCSDEISEVQPMVMRSVGGDNPMTSCEDIPEMDLTPWKDASSPILKAGAVVPETWLNFKTEINKTVQDIVDFFGKTPPPPGSPDWATFRDFINKSFSDIRGELSALHPQPANVLTADLDKKPEGGKKPPGKFNYMQFMMDKSLTDLTKYTKTAAVESTTYDDWMTFKDEVRKALNDALVSVTGMPTAAQREELKKQIETEISDLKKEITSVKAAKLSLGKEAAIEDPAVVTDWLIFKTDIVKAIGDAVDRIKANAPPPGDPAWAVFGPEIKSQFASLKNYIPVLPAKQMLTEDPAATAYWDNLRANLNKSITNAVADVDHNMPAPGDPAWAAFGSKIRDEFAGLRPMPNLQVKDPAVKEPKVKNPAFAVYWDNFRDSLNKTINKAVTDLAAKNLPPGDPAWAGFGLMIMNKFTTFQNKYMASKTMQVLQAKETVSDPTIAAFWTDFRSAINASVHNAVSDISGKSLPPGDPAWAAFGAKIMNNFVAFRDRFAAFHAKTPTEMAAAAEKAAPFDWFTFKTDIINSVAETVNAIKSNMPPPGSPAWIAFKGQVIKGFSKIPGQVSTLKLTAEEKPKKAPKPGKPFDWLTFKDEMTTTVTEIMDGKTVRPAVMPGKPKFADMGGQFAKFDKGFQALKSDIDTLRPMPEESQFSMLKKDWMEFKAKINKSLTDTIQFINTNAPPKGHPDWLSFGDSIKSEFAAIKNEINFVKSEASLKAPPTQSLLAVNDKQEVQPKTNKKTDNLPDFSSDLFSLRKGTTETLGQLKKTIGGMKLGAPMPVISAADWIAFKQEVNDAVTHFVDAFNGTQAQEWKNMKDFVKTSFAELRNEIIALRSKTAGVKQQASPPDSTLQLKLQAKKPADPKKNGPTPVTDQMLADWDSLKSDVNSTVEKLLGDIETIGPAHQAPAKVLKKSLMDAQSKLANLKIPPSLMLKDLLPPEWAVYVNAVDKSLNDVMKKINALKPTDPTDLIAATIYEKQVDNFFDQAKDLVGKKKDEFEALFLASGGSSIFVGAIATIVPIWIIFIGF